MPVTLRQPYKPGTLVLKRQGDLETLEKPVRRELLFKDTFDTGTFAWAPSFAVNKGFGILDECYIGFTGHKSPTGKGLLMVGGTDSSRFAMIERASVRRDIKTCMFKVKFIPLLEYVNYSTAALHLWLERHYKRPDGYYFYEAGLRVLLRTWSDFVLQARTGLYEWVDIATFQPAYSWYGESTGKTHRVQEMYVVVDWENLTYVEAGFRGERFDIRKKKIGTIYGPSDGYRWACLTFALQLVGDSAGRPRAVISEAECWGDVLG